MHRARHPGLLFAAAVAVATALGVLPGAGQPQEGSRTMTQEYFVQQSANEALLVRIDGFEAEFESRIRDAEGKGILMSDIAHNRVVPVFQYVAEPGKARQLSIEVKSTAQTSRSRFELGLTRLTVWDERSSAVSHAYRLLSYGMQTAPSETAAGWTVRITSLSDAASVFQQYGMNEMRLWSRYLAAHLIQYRLHDYSIAYRLSREMLAELSVTHIPDIELATRELQNDALIGLKRKGALPAGDTDPVQAALARTVAFAASMGSGYAQAKGLALSAAEYALEGLFSEALEQYQRALALADAVGDAGLSKQIRERVVEIHTREGNAPATGEVLQQIETQLARQGDGDELALNLLAQGRLLADQFRYDAARKVLTEALGYQDHTAIRKQLEFELARVFFQTGRFDESLSMLQDAGVRAGEHRSKRPSSIIDNDLALGLLADVQRNRGAYANMREARKAQGLYVTDSAGYLFRQGLDALAEDARDRARDLFQAATDAARAGGDRDLASLALLRACALSGECRESDAEDAYGKLAASGVPRYAAEAAYLRARIQAGAGRHTEAIRSLEALVREIHFLRHVLPGVLGAWYHENGMALSDLYLELLERSPESGDAAATSLLALTRLRLIEGYDSAAPEPEGPASQVLELRASLAERTRDRAADPALVGKITLALGALREPFGEQFAYLSMEGIRRYLDSLDKDEVLLTWHAGGSNAQVWAGRQGRVVRRAIGQPASLAQALAEAHDSLAKGSEAAFLRAMELLGRRLLEPVADLHAKRIYWLPAGPLLGLPLDALRLDGRYLAERHSVAAVLSFPGNPGPARSLLTGDVENTFLAGNPQDYSAEYASRFETSDEIRALVDLFVGPGLHVIQGAALLPDEFQDPRFTQADVVHLAMPGVIDLRTPSESSLELSGSEFGPRRTLYRLEGLGPGSLRARVLFLSSTRTQGQPVSAFNGNPGLVSGFATAGASAVIADLWATEGAADRAFLLDFYRELDRTGDAALALQTAKRHYLGTNRDTGLFGWAGYQLFIP